MDVSRARTKDPGEWLETCPDFSQPLVEQLVELILHWEPDLTDSIKWNMLCFSSRKLVCGLSGCKKHLGIVFFRGTELPDPKKLFDEVGEKNANIRNIRITTLEGLDRAALRTLLHAAVELDSEPMIPRPPRMKRRKWPMPAYFKKALAEKRNKVAAENLLKLAPSCQQEYIVWLATAKRPETQARRLKETLAALASGRKWAQRKDVA